MLDKLADIASITGGISPVMLFLAVFSAGLFLLLFAARFRALGQQGKSIELSPAGRYHPMLRLLAADDFALSASNPILARDLKTRRISLFRRYLRCLTRDYGRALEGIRLVMVQSGVDRPDLARALVKNRVLFALAICRIEIRLVLFSFGIGRIDVSGVVEAFDRLREHTAALTAVPVAA